MFRTDSSAQRARALCGDRSGTIGYYRIEGEKTLCSRARWGEPFRGWGSWGDRQ